MIKQILTYPKDKEILSMKSEVVQKEEDISQLIKDLRDTLNAQSDGAGISAVQIGVLKRVCLIHYNYQDIVLINPEITWRRSGPHSTKVFQEGCLSVPGVFKQVERSQKVTCKYLDENWEEQVIDQGGWASAIIQHELDHMEGICVIAD